MGVMTKKYGVSISFWHKLTIFGKTTPMDFEQKIEIF
jgi:hypothetical protein